MTDLDKLEAADIKAIIWKHWNNKNGQTLEERFTSTADEIAQALARRDGVEERVAHLTAAERAYGEDAAADMIAHPAPTAPGDGWIEWHGGPNPVGDEPTEVRFRDWPETLAKSPAILDWKHEGTSRTHVTSYRRAALRQPNTAADPCALCGRDWPESSGVATAPATTEDASMAGVEVRCVNAHDRCHEGGSCPYCEPADPRPDPLEALREARDALKFYADPWNHPRKAAEDLSVPDFYDEMDFGTTADQALAKIKAVMGEAE
jgi:hypothetical protein